MTSGGKERFGVTKFPGVANTCSDSGRGERGKSSFDKLEHAWQIISRLEQNNFFSFVCHFLPNRRKFHVNEGFTERCQETPRTK